jgi:hypothetical protein
VIPPDPANPGRRRRTAGWREWVAIPSLGIAAIKAKLDTGARTSAVHAFDIRRSREGGIDVVRFQVHPLQRDVRLVVACKAPLLDERWVRTSGGGAEYRPVVSVDIEFAGERWPIELTLAHRGVMGFRMLLGRQALRGRLVVDPGRSFVAGRRHDGEAR